MGTIKEKLDKMLASKNAIKAAIIEKGQAVEDVLSSYPAAIKAIKTGTDTSDANAAEGDILSGKIAYGASGKLIGTIPSKGSGDLSASGANIIVPAGYYPSQVQKSVVTANQATPTISVSSGGLITASATQGEGYVAAGTKSGTKQLTTQAAKTITPGTTQQTAVASGRYTTGAVTVKGDANLKAENIKSGASIFGVAGSFEGARSFNYTELSVKSVTSSRLIMSFSGASIDTDNLAGFSVYLTGGTVTDPNSDRIAFSITCHKANSETNLLKSVKCSIFSEMVLIEAGNDYVGSGEIDISGNDIILSLQQGNGVFYTGSGRAYTGQVFYV